MSTLENTRTRRLGTESLDAIANDTQRRVLVALADASGPVSERELAATFVADERDEDADSVDGETLRSVHTELYHAHLPALAEAGLVSWNRSRETVAPVDHPLLDDGRFEKLLRTDGDEWDDVRACVGDETRLAVLDVLASRPGPVARRALARELAAREVSGSPSESAVSDVEVQLHHAHLPKLDEAGLVDYDLDAETVASGETAVSPVGDLLAGA
ncbi:hypothetical protein [Halosimplex sp. TS25]|uniref:DUF7344 domain-containing protein n=1 Tax=Halosimplex rarum TaxID=3396619 RepID=UPI0039ED1C5C